MQKTANTKGFTIIEVVLVLAIAGLIFLIVFLALPALQRSQRDTQRKNDLSRLMSQVSNYSSNNQGAVPDTQTKLDDFRTRYLTTNDSFNDPTTGNVYTTTLKATSTWASDKPGVGTIYYYLNAKCSGESVTTGAGNRNVAIVTQLESNAYYCQGN